MAADVRERICRARTPGPAESYMSDMAWTYPNDLLAALVAFGLAPTSETPPRLVRDQLNDLYRFEIRRLKGRLLADEFPKEQYVDYVIALRKRALAAQLGARRVGAYLRRTSAKSESVRR